MKALILLGGLGTRLRPFTLEKPKPLLPIVNKAFIGYQLDQLKKHGIREVVLALGYAAGHFRRTLGDGRVWGMRFVYSLEQQPLGTGGAIRKALPSLKGPTFVLNGDVLSDIDLAKLWKAHRASRAAGTLTLKAVKDPSKFGLIETTAAGRIRKFIEKPSPEEMSVNTINAGFYVFEESVVRAIPENQAVSIERDVFPKLLKSGVHLHTYLHQGYWSDIGTLKSYWETHMDLTRDFKAADYPVRRVREGLWAGKNCKIHGAVKVQGTAVLGEGCRVAANVVFRGGVVLGPGCVVEEDALVADSVVQARTRIGAKCRVENSLLGERCSVGDNSQVGPGAVVAGRSKLGPYSQQVAGLTRDANGNA